ncbi:phage tail protein [Actinokineospora enzanensis]|uniref:phage tail protein n=1 Tax=Actinokineospora enzanensis TaxID=155975 RepID=UPI00036C2F2D|nr:phage tail protein [Actinokineospora enzanensis]
MTRAAVPDLPTRRPLGDSLPAVYAADGFVQRLTGGLDVVFAPLLSTLDNFAAYLAPECTPADFVAWLGSWVAADMSDGWPESVRRAAVAGAADAHRWRGTARGLVARLWLCAGVRAEVSDGPGATWSATPGAGLDGGGEVTVRVWSDGGEVDLDLVRSIVATACPLHVRWSVAVADGRARP